MLTPELFNTIIVFTIISFVITGYILYIKLNQTHLYFSFKNNLKRTRNGFKRFFKRLKTIWPMHIFFTIALITIFILKKIQVINNLEQYLLSFINLIIIIYFIDFINSEQSRRDSANKRFLVDVEIYQVISSLSLVFDWLLYETKSVRTENSFPPYQLSYSMTEEDISQIINSPGFWENEVSFFMNVYETQTTNRKNFLKENIHSYLLDVQLFLTKYSSLVLYNDFKLIHNFEYELKRINEALKYDINFIEDNISSLLFDLIELNQKCEIILDKWHN